MNSFCLYGVDSDWRGAVEEAAVELGLPLAPDGYPVRVELGGKGLRIETESTGIRVRCGNRTAAFRALSLLPEALEKGALSANHPVSH